MPPDAGSLNEKEASASPFASGAGMNSKSGEVPQAAKAARRSLLDRARGALDVAKNNGVRIMFL